MPDQESQVVDYLLEMELGEINEWSSLSKPITVEKDDSGNFVVVIDGFKQFFDDVNDCALNLIEDGAIPDDFFEEEPEGTLEVTYEVTMQFWDRENPIPTEDDVRTAVIDGMFRRGFNDLHGVNVERR